ncbi:hypothetical protein E4656_03065 [Natronospirillum operosum]|uniref:Integrase catalytic domain-containing protein n=1 Tax=Natronospirillum operosum TaxID=2759953 RepID=A0A4Z0W9X5_9GAMM|nr:hypothetical protein E4656_03065 [Natronospirillum operosum]
MTLPLPLDTDPFGMMLSRLDWIALAKSATFDYVEVLCNRKRRHSSLGYLSPVEYERRCV